MLRLAPIPCLFLLALGAIGCGDDDGPADAFVGACATAADCNDTVFCNGPETCDPSDPRANERGCVPGLSPCSAGRCLEASRECEDVCVDADGDGEGDVACGGTDCDDGDAAINTAAIEICDLEGVDEDCDGTTFGDRDIDGDGAIDARCCNGTECGTDCDETRAGTNPGVAEVCDGRDNDCDGDVDEGLLQAVYADVDRDQHGDPDRPIMACPGVVAVSETTLDCDDADPFVNRALAEIEDGRDNDCDGAIDEDPMAITWYPDGDGDLFGTEDFPDTMVSSVVVPGFSIVRADCDDANGARNPLATEVCNGIDDDCDGQADFVIGVNDWEDDDGDGYPDDACATGPNADCDDTDPTAHPDHDEVCGDYRDNDCDTAIDEGCGGTPMDGGVPDGGQDMGPTFCEDSGMPLMDLTGDGTGTVVGSDSFTVAESVANWQVSWSGDLYTGELRIVLGEYSNVCGYARAWAQPTGLAYLVAVIQVQRTGSAPDFPTMGTYGYVPYGGAMTEDVPALRDVQVLRSVLPPGGECSANFDAPPEVRDGSVTLSTANASRVIGMLDYTEEGGLSVDVTFDTPVVDTCQLEGLEAALGCCTDPATAPVP